MLRTLLTLLLTLQLALAPMASGEAQQNPNQRLLERWGYSPEEAARINARIGFGATLVELAAGGVGVLKAGKMVGMFDNSASGKPRYTELKVPVTVDDAAFKGGGSATLPDKYTRNADGTISGPQGGIYSIAGTDLNGQKVYKDSAGRYYTFNSGTKADASNPAGKPNVTIPQQQAHHQAYVDDIKDQLQSQGYTVTSGGFYSNCGSTICYPDVIYSAPGSNKITGIVEIKTGGAVPSDNQTMVYPQIGTGDATPSSGFAQNWNQSYPTNPLTAGVSMNQQGYPNGIPIYQISAPGLGE